MPRRLRAMSNAKRACAAPTGCLVPVRSVDGCAETEAGGEANGLAACRCGEGARPSRAPAPVTIIAFSIALHGQTGVQGR